VSGVWQGLSTAAGVKLEEDAVKESSAEIPHAEVVESVLRSEFGEARAREIIQQAGIGYGKLMAEREQVAHRALRQHLEENILPGVALYRTLLAGEDTRDRAEQLVEGAFRAWAESGRRSMARLPFFYGLLRVLIRPVMRLNFPAPGWETEWLEASRQALAFNMRSCFYLDVLEGYGVPELTKYYCAMDDLTYEGISPHVSWARTKTLGRGDDCCDFRFERVRRP
jgi:hypothetical protein